MFDKVEKELNKECRNCRDECRKYGCVVWRIREIMTAHEIEVSQLNIDDFFEEALEDQLTLFG